jgi:phosphoesterase RecJ-like protein
VLSLTANIIELIKSAQSIVITTHVNPDGDGFCAALALQRILSVWNKDSIILTDDDDLSRYAFLMDQCNVAIFRPDAPPLLQTDLLFILDCNSYDRLGNRRVLVEPANHTVLLDHHVVEHDPITADYVLIDPAYVSVGAIVFELFRSYIFSQSPEDQLYVANCLYTTILNDTNNYANANTNAAVFTFAAELCALGIKPHVLYKEYFLNHSAEEMRYVGETLSTIELHFNRKLLTMYSTLEMLDRNNLNADSIMNITRWVQGVQGLDAIAYIREDAPGKYVLSLRSVKLNVNQIAVSYGGGGHRQASGATVYGTFNEVMSMILRDFRKAIETHEQSLV